MTRPPWQINKYITVKRTLYIINLTTLINSHVQKKNFTYCHRKHKSVRPPHILYHSRTCLQQHHNHHQYIEYKLFVQLFNHVLLATLCPCPIQEMAYINNMLKVLLIPCSFFHCPLIMV